MKDRRPFSFHLVDEFINFFLEPLLFFLECGKQQGVISVIYKMSI